MSALVWQPIETIPSGDPVLVWDGKGIYVAEAPVPGNVLYLQEPHRGRLITEWSHVGPDGDFYAETGAPFPGFPTHWMPLPSPPVLA